MLLHKSHLISKDRLRLLSLIMMPMHMPKFFLILKHLTLLKVTSLKFQTLPPEHLFGDMSGIKLEKLSLAQCNS